MRTKGEYKEGKLKLMVENNGLYSQTLKEAYYQEEGSYFVKSFNGTFENADQIIDNFNRLMPDLFTAGDWESALLFIAEQCQKHHIAWFLTGSACDAVRGIDIVPHDLDIEIYSSQWKQAEQAFSDYIIEPFIESKGWVREHFGRLIVNHLQVDMVADTRYDLINYDYEPLVWKGYTLWLEPFMTRYRTEIQRQRTDRINLFEQFLVKNGLAFYIDNNIIYNH